MLRETFTPKRTLRLKSLFFRDDKDSRERVRPLEKVRKFYLEDLEEGEAGFGMEGGSCGKDKGAPSNGCEIS